MACRTILCDSCMALKSLADELKKMGIKMPFSSDARRAAKRLGWKYTHDKKTDTYKDYCPECAKKKNLS